LLEQGRLLLLLDGLDEVPSPHQDAVIDHIQDFVDRHANNRYIASCRTAAYHSRFRRFTDVLMADFDDGQIEHFITRWFASPRDLEARTAERCRDTLSDPDHTAAKELAQNPLLLTLLCLVFEDNQCFPANRAILYGDALDVLLRRWAAEKRIHRDPIYKDLTLPLEKAMLGRLAHDFFQAGRLFFPRAEATAAVAGFLANNLNAPRHLDGDEVLKEIEIQQGILVARDHSGGVLSFSHLTFQEYLTAQHLTELISDWDEMARHHLLEAQWREVFLLAAGQARPNADGLLRAMARQCRVVALDCPSLAALFRWAGAVTNASPGVARSAAKRAAVVGLAFGLARAIAFNLDPANVHDLDRSIAHASTLARVLDPAHALADALELARALDPAHTYARVRARALILELILDLFQALVNQGVFKRFMDISDFTSKEQQSGLESDRVQIGPTELCYRLGLSAEKLNSIPADSSSICQCLVAYQLLLNCKAAAMAVSPGAWAEIEADLFLVDEPEFPPALIQRDDSAML
jgi:hypothetical protein